MSVFNPENGKCYVVVGNDGELNETFVGENVLYKLAFQNIYSIFYDKKVFPAVKALLKRSLSSSVFQ